MATERRSTAIALGGLLFLAGCASPVAAPVEPPYGGVFSLYSAPLETNFEATPVGSKVGTIEMRHFEIPYNTSGSRLPVATWASAAIAEAAANGGIQRIHYADYEVLGVLGVYFQLTVRVYGD
jgi:hypothetical protein